MQVHIPNDQWHFRLDRFLDRLRRKWWSSYLISSCTASSGTSDSQLTERISQTHWLHSPSDKQNPSSTWTSIDRTLNLFHRFRNMAKNWSIQVFRAGFLWVLYEASIS